MAFEVFLPGPMARDRALQTTFSVPWERVLFRRLREVPWAVSSENDCIKRILFQNEPLTALGASKSLF